VISHLLEELIEPAQFMKAFAQPSDLLASLVEITVSKLRRLLLMSITPATGIVVGWLTPQEYSFSNKAKIFPSETNESMIVVDTVDPTNIMYFP